MKPVPVAATELKSTELAGDVNEPFLHGSPVQLSTLFVVTWPVSDIASRRHLRSADRRLLNVPHQRRSIHFPGGLSLWPVGVELVAGLPERPSSQQRHFLQASKDVYVCIVLIYVQRIRGFYNDALYKSTFYLLTSLCFTGDAHWARVAVLRPYTTENSLSFVPR